MEILSRIDSLADHPDLGRVVPEYDQRFLRELIHPSFVSSTAAAATSSRSCGGASGCSSYPTTSDSLTREARHRCRRCARLGSPSTLTRLSLLYGTLPGERGAGSPRRRGWGPCREIAGALRCARGPSTRRRDTAPRRRLARPLAAAAVANGGGWSELAAPATRVGRRRVVGTGHNFRLVVLYDHSGVSI